VECFTLLRTDRDGWIELITDGEQMWVEVERGLGWQREVRIFGI